MQLKHGKPFLDKTTDMGEIEMQKRGNSWNNEAWKKLQKKLFFYLQKIFFIIKTQKRRNRNNYNCSPEH